MLSSAEPKKRKVILLGAMTFPLKMAIHELVIVLDFAVPQELKLAQ